MDKKINSRDILIAGLMIGAALIVTLNPIKKTTPGEKIQLSSFIPESFPGWRSVTFDTAEYKDKWQSINELLIRVYYKTWNRKPVNFVLEYSSDLRKNFSFHFPENCHRAGGNEVDFLAPLEVDLGNNKLLTTKFLYIKGIKGSPVEKDHLIAYWLVIDNKQFYKTFFIKLDQMFAGLLNQSKKGFLVRVDYIENLEYTEKSITEGTEMIRQFIVDLYENLDQEERVLVFGEDLY